jgi:DNA-binding transcriptional ArsR family regulator
MSTTAARGREEALDAVFFALSDPTRRKIVARLFHGEQSVSAIAAPFDMTLPGVTKHLRVLSRAGLVVIHREGTTRRCRLHPAPLEKASAFLDHYRAFWEGNLLQLEHWAKEKR